MQQYLPSFLDDMFKKVFITYLLISKLWNKRPKSDSRDVFSLLIKLFHSALAAAFELRNYENRRTERLLAALLERYAILLYSK